jgi:hypothetical protein
MSIRRATGLAGDLQAAAAQQAPGDTAELLVVVDDQNARRHQ